METEVLTRVQAKLTQFKGAQVRVALDLLNDGNTIPFVARYRKEATGSLDEVALQTIQEQAKKEQELFDRKNAVIKLIEAAGKLTAPLQEKIQGADDLATVEDLYLPYKQKRRTKALVAKENGLMPLANWLLKYETADPKSEAAHYVNQEVLDAEAALAGAQSCRPAK